MFPGLDKHIFDDPEFKEDSVRELILAPMLARLGYLPTGRTRVVRSRTLKHPFIRVGTREHPVTVIPDYTLLHDEKPIFVLDAKSPHEDVLQDSHVQQAYSYAMHPEVGCREFGLCNGRTLAVFDVFHRQPLTTIDFEDFEKRWSDVEKYLHLKFLLDPRKRRYAPDFGAALLRMGVPRDREIVLPNVRLNLFGRVNDRLYTACSNANFGTIDHCASFDFPAPLLPDILAGLPAPLREQFTQALSEAPFQAAAGLALELAVAIRLGEPTNGLDEEFVPLVIEKVLSSWFDPRPIDESLDTTPDNVFKLRRAFSLVEEAEAGRASDGAG